MHLDIDSIELHLVLVAFATYQNPYMLQNPHEKTPEFYDKFDPSNAEATSSKAQGCNFFCKLSKPCHIGINWKALTECSQMSTLVPVLRSSFIFFASFYIGKN